MLFRSGLADDLVEGANMLQNTVQESKGVIDSIAQEQTRHDDAMTELIKAHRQLGDSFDGAI